MNFQRERRERRAKLKAVADAARNFQNAPFPLGSEETNELAEKLVQALDDLDKKVGSNGIK